MRHAEHFLIIALVAVSIPKHRTEGVAPLRLTLGETSLESCGTDTALGLSDTCNVTVCLVFLNDTLCRLLLAVFTSLVGYGEIRRVLHNKLFQETVTIDRKTAYLLNTVFV